MKVIEKMAGQLIEFIEDEGLRSMLDFERM